MGIRRKGKIMQTICDQVQRFIKNKDIDIIPSFLRTNDAGNIRVADSTIARYTADLFQEDEIPLRLSNDKISRVCAERSLLNFPGKDNQSIDQVYDYTALVSFGYPHKNMYLSGKEAHQIFSMMEQEKFMRIQSYYAHENLQQAIDYYDTVYNIMSSSGCTNNVKYNTKQKTIESVRYGMFCLFAAYIMNCETHEKIENGFEQGFECGIGKTSFHCSRTHTYYIKSLDPDMNKMFFFWCFDNKDDKGAFWNTMYDEKQHPYEFSGLGADLLSLYDNVYNCGKRMFPGPFTKRFLGRTK